MKYFSSLIWRLRFRRWAKKSKVNDGDWVKMTRKYAKKVAWLKSPSTGYINKKPVAISDKQRALIIKELKGILSAFKDSENESAQANYLCALVYKSLVFAAEAGINLNSLMKIKHDEKIGQVATLYAKNGKLFDIGYGGIGKKLAEDRIKMEIKVQQYLGSFLN